MGHLMREIVAGVDGGGSKTRLILATETGEELADNALLTAHKHGLVKRGFIDFKAARAFAADCITRFNVKAGGPAAEARSLSGGNLQKYIMGREILLAPDSRFTTWDISLGASFQIDIPLVTDIAIPRIERLRLSELPIQSELKRRQALFNAAGERAQRRGDLDMVTVDDQIHAVPLFRLG